MSETPYNPNDPAFLLSRSLDDELTDDERRRLDEALASSPSLQAEAEKLRALDRLIKHWGAQQAALDLDHHAALIIAQTAGDDDADKLKKVDQLIERWASKNVLFDADRFTAVVMDRVAQELDREMRRGWIFRLGAPLAAAAAVVFAVIGGAWWGSKPEAVCRVEFGPRVAMVTAPTDMTVTPSAMVSFGRAPVEPFAETSTGISFGTVGSSAPVAMPGESPPL